MNILAVRDRVASILNEAEGEDQYVVIYAAGLVPEDWPNELTNRSQLAPYWFADQKQAMARNRHQLWPEDPGMASSLIVAKTLKTNLGRPNQKGEIVLRKHSVILVQLTVNGQSVRPDLQNKQITYIKPVKKPVDIDAIAPAV